MKFKKTQSIIIQTGFVSLKITTKNKKNCPDLISTDVNSSPSDDRILTIFMLPFITCWWIKKRLLLL